MMKKMAWIFFVWLFMYCGTRSTQGQIYHIVFSDNQLYNGELGTREETSENCQFIADEIGFRCLNGSIALVNYFNSLLKDLDVSNNATIIGPTNITIASNYSDLVNNYLDSFDVFEESNCFFNDNLTLFAPPVKRTLWLGGIGVTNRCNDWSSSSACINGEIIGTTATNEPILSNCGSVRPFLCLCKNGLPYEFPPTPQPSKTPTTSKPSSSPSTSKPSFSPSTSPVTSQPSTTPTTSKPSKTPSGAPTASPTLALCEQQGLKLIGNDVDGAARQGTSVSISGDGNTIAVGGPMDDSDTGAVWIYARDTITGTWSQQGSKLIGSGLSLTENRGTSVALSSDGNTLAFGSPSSSSNQGAVRIFTRTGVTWLEETTLLSSGSIGNAKQGTSVSLSADGNTLAIGGPEDNSGVGAVWIWTRSLGIWTEYGSKLIGAGSAGNAKQGTSVAVSGDGLTVAIGGPYYTVSPLPFSFRDAAWIFTYSGSVWSQQGPRLNGTCSLCDINDPLLGHSLALSYNGDTLACGGPDYFGIGVAPMGAVWMYTRTSGIWAQQARVQLASTGSSRIGTSVSLSSDGDILAFGGSADSSSRGAAWIFTRSVSTWTLRTKLVGSNSSVPAYQGSGVSLSSDGSKLAVGGYGDDTDVGAAWTFDCFRTSAPSQSPSTNPSKAPTPPPSHPPTKSPSQSPSTSKPSTSPSLSPTLAPVAATSMPSQSPTVNVCYQQGSKFVGSGYTTIAQLGYHLAISDDLTTLAVGAPTSTNGGRVFIFIRDSNGDWIQQGSALTGSDRSGGARQGSSVALSSDGNTLAFGGYNDAFGNGAAWVFTRTGVTWTQQGSKLSGIIGMGQSVALSSDGDTLAVGAPYNAAIPANSGSTRVYTRSAGVWSIEASSLSGTGVTASALQGHSVALSSDGNTLAVGAPGDDSETGAVWIYTRSGVSWSQQGSKLIGSGASAGSKSGYHVSLTSDGDTLAIGGFGVWVFTRSAGTWSQQGGILTSKIDDGLRFNQQPLGYSVSLTDDSLMVGDNSYGSYVGSNQVYTRSGGVWSLYSNLLSGSSKVGSAEEGASVSAKVSGSHLIVVSGGPFDNSLGAFWQYNCSLI
jgi:hypothetical protein